MSDLTMSKVIALITAQCKKIVRQQSSGISDVKWDTATHSLVFTLTNGKTVSVAITASANGITYSNTTSKLDSNDVQSAIDEILVKLNKKILELSKKTAYLNEQNNFTALNSFETETTFNNAITVNEADIGIDNGVVLITDNTEGKDIVTQYSADEIVISENGSNSPFSLKFPKENGEFITTAKFNIKHSIVKNRDINSDKEDVWLTEDPDANISMSQEDSTTNTSVSVRKNYAEISSATLTDQTENSSVMVTSNSIEFTSAKNHTSEGKQNKLEITPEKVVLNDKNLVTEDDLSKKLDKNTTPGGYIRVYGISKDGTSTFVSIDDELGLNKTNLVQNNTITKAINGKQDKLTAGSRIVIDPSTNTIKSVTNYIELSGESGEIDNDQMTMLQGDDMVVLRRSGILYRLNSKPINGSGDYVFISDFYDTGEIESYSSYAIVLKQDRKWTWKSLKDLNSQGAVLYVAQQLSQEQKNQACKNIGMNQTFENSDGVTIIRNGNIVMQSKTFTMQGNSEKVFSFPISYDSDKKPMCWCNSSAEGMSVNNSSAVISYDSNAMIVRTCGVESTVTFFAQGWVTKK